MTCPPLWGGGDRRRRWVRFYDVALVLAVISQNLIRRASRATFPRGEGLVSGIDAETVSNRRHIMLKTVKWKKYKALGNLDLDFRKPDGSAYSTVILAGDNGTGKTTILETLGQFLTGNSIEPFEYIEYEAQGEEFHIVPIPGQAGYGFHQRKNISNGKIKTIGTNTLNNPHIMKNDPENIRSYGCIYSSANSKFDTIAIQSITTQQIDETKYEFDDRKNFTDIKQLLVDIDAQDAKAYKRANQEHNVALTDFEPSSKMYRFKTAFNNFFDTIQFDRIDDTVRNVQNIIFKKHNQDVLIDNLSTGEKQIVFRGSYLLKNSKSVNGGIILIDEPELSMHPKWQEKILPFYQNLFTQNGEQKAQIIIATHSEYVIRKALEDKDNTLVIILKDDNGTVKGISSRTPYILPHVTAAEVNFQAFNIYSVDYHIQLYGYLQMLTTCSRIGDMDAYLRPIATSAGLPAKTAVRNEKTEQETLPTYIRNAIDHPDNTSRNFTDEELKQATDFLIQHIQTIRPAL